MKGIGFLDLIKNKLTGYIYAPVTSNRRPIYRQSGRDVYTSDVVQQAIACIASEMSKLEPQHIVRSMGDDVPQDSDVNRILHSPNPLMTTADFLEKIIWQLYLTYNSFIVPVKEGKKLVALYPMQPDEVSFIQDSNETLYVKLHFENGYETTIRYDQVIHIRLKFALNEFMGGNKSGQPDLDVLIETIGINDALLDGVASAVKNSFSINAVVKYNTMLDKGKMETNLKELTDRLQNNESGFLPMDLKGEFIPLKKDIALVDEKTLQFIDSKILRHFGVSLPILTGDYTTAQYEAFYQKTLEPLIIKLSQAFTKGIFSDKARGHGNLINFYAKELIFLSTDQKIEMVRLLGDSGTLYENEKRRAFGLRPDPALVGVRMQSLNYVNVKIANQYQLKEGSNEE